MKKALEDIARGIPTDPWCDFEPQDRWHSTAGKKLNEARNAENELQGHWAQQEDQDEEWINSVTDEAIAETP